MKRIITMDSAYCSMGRWISVIVASKLQMKLYEGKDLLALANADLSAEELAAFDDWIADMSVEDVRKDGRIYQIHEWMKVGIQKAIEIGPCIIHERAATEVLGERADVLKVLLYNTDMTHRIKRARLDKTYDLSDKTNAELIAFIEREDRKRKVYRDALSSKPWGEKESYDICLDSYILSREKCAEILVEACQDVRLDLDECARIISASFR